MNSGFQDPEPAEIPLKQGKRNETKTGLITAIVLKLGQQVPINREKRQKDRWFHFPVPREGVAKKPSCCKSVCPLQGSKNPKIGKRGFRSQKTPISPHPRKGSLETKNPHFPCGALYRNGDFLTRDALFWGGGKWGFFDSETLFSQFWGFLTPVRGKRIRNRRV